MRIPVIAVVVSALVRAPSAAAQEHPVNWSLMAPKTAVAGRKFQARLHATIPPGWHLYSTTQPPGGPIATTISSDTVEFRITGVIDGPAPETAIDNNFGIVTETWLDSVTLAVPLIARRPGPDTLRLNVGYQTCTDRYCLPPMTDILAAAVRVEGAPEVAVVEPRRDSATAPSPAPSGPATRAPPTGPPPNAPHGTTSTLPIFLWLAMGMGALSLITPCVFPMIPITVSYFTRSGETSRRAPWRNALVYAVGIIATFTVLGMAMAMLVGAGGINRFAANPIVNLLIAALFVAFALNLFGAYQVSMPGGAVTRLDAFARRSGKGTRPSETTGILLMGLTFTLTSFTCTAPFVGTLLVMAADGNWSWPMLGLLAYSAVFALPFFVLAAVPAAAARLPRSGAWLQSVKVAMGFLELAAAVKFVSNVDLVLHWGVFTRTVVIAAWLAIAIGLLAYLIVGMMRGARPGLMRLAMVIACVAIAVQLGRGLAGHRLGELESYVPPVEGAVATGVATVPGELPWLVNDYQLALTRARREQKPVLVDFTGYTCTNCRWMEANMFPRPAVEHQLERFVRVRLYTDGAGDRYREQQRLEQEKLGTVALPYYAIVDSLGVVQARFLGMTRNTGEFAAFLGAGDAEQPVAR